MEIMNSLEEVKQAIEELKTLVDEQSVDLYLAQKDAMELFIDLRKIKNNDNAKEVEKLAEEILNLVKFIGHEIIIQENEIKLTNSDI